MSSLPSPLRRAGRLLAAHVRRLRVALVRLAAEVRAAVAGAVGQATGDAVRDALRVILDGPPARHTPARDPPEDSDVVWGQPRRPRWPSAPYAGHYDPYEMPQRETDYLEDDQDVEPDEDPAPEGPEAQPAGAWSRAAAMGCQAAAWWLRRHPGPLALLVAAGVGVAAGLAALAGGPLVAGGSAAAAAALAALALADAARSAADLAGDALP
jgi:hypothetical protein